MSSVAVSVWPTFESLLVGSWSVAGQTTAFRFDRLLGPDRVTACEAMGEMMDDFQ